MSDEQTAEERYSDFYARQLASPTLRRIYQEVYGDDHPAELQTFGFVTRTDLALLGERLALRPGRLLADLGCGRGGPGIALARQALADLVGIDVVQAALDGAAVLSAALGLPQARFLRGSFTATGLPDRSCDAVMSVDALWMVWNKPAAFLETSRILRPGGRFVFTTWEPAYLDHTRMLANAGFAILERRETDNWLARQLAVYQRITAARAALAAELGPGSAVLLTEAAQTPGVLPTTPRVMITAELRASPPRR
ncbi:Methyltransferase domain-containing protein [Sinosporangium album]|uniref:Methyltransferase domain-containing protein n=1 Tax=Sinosporangium album TaxID=504805 RepID=A0A1G7ZQP9_9ACTN|nr:methyltransferase domain-containing protein [Sinosporangium album]SDH10989.1 Methyltransferase domain-containing protein [Sinosporangium album]